MIRSLIKTIARELDLPYLRYWLAEFADLPEHEKVLTDFEGLLRQ